MIKKLLPLVVMALLTACANTQTASTDSHGKMACCEKCECCKSGDCGDCCKNGKCDCCTDGSCPMCNQKAAKSAANEEEPCQVCEEAERKARADKAKHGKMKH